MNKITYLVKATNKYLLENCYDGGLGRIPAEGETWTVDEERYKLLSEKGYVTLVKKNIPETPIQKDEPKKEKTYVKTKTYSKRNEKNNKFYK